MFEFARKFASQETEASGMLLGESSCRVRIGQGLANRSRSHGTAHRLDESGRLLLGGSLASVARLRFTG